MCYVCVKVFSQILPPLHGPVEEAKRNKWFFVNPFKSHAADVFHHFVYIISATIILLILILCM